MSKNQVYVDAVRTILTQNGGGPMRGGEVFTQAKAQGLLPDVKFAYNYTLKAAKTSPEFDTSKRGWIALANTGIQTQAGETEELVSDFVATGNVA